MKKLFLILIFCRSLWADSGFVDQVIVDHLVLSTQNFYAFDSRFQSLNSRRDIYVKIRHSYFGTFKQEGKSLTGEMSKTKGSMIWQDVFLHKLILDEFQGSLQMQGGLMESSSINDLKVDQLILHNTRIMKSIWSGVVAGKSEFKNVVFSESNLQAALPGLQAENVKFLGHTGALNLRGCSLKNVEFNFESIQYLNLTGCRLENVFVNGQSLTNISILQ